MAEVVTGEAVVLDLNVARFPSRIAALLIDAVLQAVTLTLVLVIVVATAIRHLNGAWAAAIILSSYVLVVIGYPTAFETVSRGRTLGKMALGLRVIGDDGSPERFRQALVRSLAGLIEIWSLPAIGLITAMIQSRGKRLGDIFAGTFVVQERSPRRQALPQVFASVPPPLASWAQNLELSRLSDQNAEAAGSFLRRFYDLRADARDALGLQLATAVAAQVSPPPPPGTPPAAYLAAVLAVRRSREYARFSGYHSAQPGRPGPAAPAGGPTGGSGQAAGDSGMFAGPS